MKRRMPATFTTFGATMTVIGGYVMEDDSEWPTSAWKTCLDCGLADWHQSFATLIEYINKCPRCGSRRLRTEIKRRKP